VGSTGRRIARIKLTLFIEALGRTMPGLEIPEKLPAMVSCLLPDHDDPDPSFWLREHRWHCFGCSRGGDVVDFVQAYHDVDLHDAISLVEVGLGYGDTDADLVALVALARAGTQSGDPTRAGWESEVVVIESTFLDRVRPYLRCADWVVSEPAWSMANYVFSELTQASLQQAPRTERGMRDLLRDLRRWVGDYAKGIERTALRLTGKDRLDVAAQRI